MHGSLELSTSKFPKRKEIGMEQCIMIYACIYRKNHNAFPSQRKQIFIGRLFFLYALLILKIQDGSKMLSLKEISSVFLFFENLPRSYEVVRGIELSIFGYNNSRTFFQPTVNCAIFPFSSVFRANARCFQKNRQIGRAHV